MNFLSEDLAFLLHESSIGRVDFQKKEIALIFTSGFWDKDHVQKSNSKMLLSIKNLCEENVNSFVNVLQYGRFKRKQIDLLSFNGILQKHEFVIDVDYYSELERSILLTGMAGNKEYHFKITDIDQIVYTYDC